MGLFLGLGLLGAAFAIDGAKQAPFDRAYRRLQNEWGVCTAEEDKRCDALEDAVKNGLLFENEKKPVITWQELRDLQWKYQLAGISWPRESAIRDVCCVAAYEREFAYKGYLRNTITVGYITDPKNVMKLGIIGNDKTPKFSERRALMSGRILAFEEKNNGKLATPLALFDFLKQEGCTTQELYNAYAQAFPDTFENVDCVYDAKENTYRTRQESDTNNCYYNGLIAALNYRSWKNENSKPQMVSEPKKKSLVTEQDSSKEISLFETSISSALFYHLEYAVTMKGSDYGGHMIYPTKELRDAEIALMKSGYNDKLEYVEYESDSVESEERLKK